MPSDPQSQSRLQGDAIGWVIRLREAGEQDWMAFTAWLEADPVHAAAYDEAALADAEAEDLPPAREPEPVASPGRFGPDGSERRSRRRFFGWAAAASIVLTGVYVGLGSGSSAYAVETGPGERRALALEDGSRIELNGRSRVELDRGRPRYARLEQGEVLFQVVHDASRPFEVEAGGTLLRDLGTVFNVVAEKQRLEVAVAEGVVLYDPAGAAKTLTPGMALRKEGQAAAKVGPVTTDAVGSWREGRLIYSAAPLATVAADLSRNLGLRVSVEDAVASRPFSGVILLAGEPHEVLGRSAALLGLKLQRTGDTWRLTRGSASS